MICENAVKFHQFIQEYSISRDLGIIEEVMSLFSRYLQLTRQLKSTVPLRLYHVAPPKKTSVQAWKICLGIVAGVGTMYWAIGFKEKSAVHAYRAPRKVKNFINILRVKANSLMFPQGPHTFW